MIPTWIAASLTNDLFSFQKEYNDAKKVGQPYVVNAVWVLMQEKGVPEEEAKLECRKRIKEEIKKAIKNAELVKEMEVSEDLKKYLELLLYSLSGNVVWSLQCPRYHKNIPYNELQLQRAKHGIAKFPARWPPMDQNGLGAKDSANNSPSLNSVSHLGGAGSPVGNHKLNGFAIDGLHTNSTQSPLTLSGVNGSGDENHSWKGNGVKVTDDLIFDTQLPQLSDKVSICRPEIMSMPKSSSLPDTVFLRSWRSPSHTLARYRPKECESTSSTPSTCG